MSIPEEQPMPMKPPLGLELKAKRANSAKTIPMADDLRIIMGRFGLMAPVCHAHIFYQSVKRRLPLTALKPGEAEWETVSFRLNPWEILLRCGRISHGLLCQTFSVEVCLVGMPQTSEFRPTPDATPCEMTVLQGPV
jgi:hypothetical protein